jgi:hypothetical protein
MQETRPMRRTPRSQRNPLRTLVAVFALLLAGCTTIPGDERPAGRHQCETFFVCQVCVSDMNFDTQVDYVYFDDTREVFMFEDSMRDAIRAVMAFHPCAIPMAESTREYSSQLMYGDDLPLSTRIAIKGRLVRNYRAAQPAVDACNRRNSASADAYVEEDPFLVQEDWDEEPL